MIYLWIMTVVSNKRETWWFLMKSDCKDNKAGILQLNQPFTHSSLCEFAPPSCWDWWAVFFSKWKDPTAFYSSIIYCRWLDAGVSQFLYNTRCVNVLCYCTEQVCFLSLWAPGRSNIQQSLSLQQKRSPDTLVSFLFWVSLWDVKWVRMKHQSLYEK